MLSGSYIYTLCTSLIVRVSAAFWQTRSVCVWFHPAWLSQQYVCIDAFPLRISSAPGPCPHLHCGSHISHLTIEPRPPSSTHPSYIVLCSLGVHSSGPFLSTNCILKVIMLQRITCLQEAEMQPKQPLSKEEGISYSQVPRKGWWSSTLKAEMTGHQKQSDVRPEKDLWVAHAMPLSILSMCQFHCLSLRHSSLSSEEIQTWRKLSPHISFVEWKIITFS